MSQRNVVKLSGERAEKKQAHWQAVAVAACEQCGRNLVPTIALPLSLSSWLKGFESTSHPAQRLVLSLQVTAATMAEPTAEMPNATWVLSGPEGGLTAQEEALAIALGWAPLSLGPRVLRAETAALAALVRLST
jgi:16S rRNA (uracil1498-N3)-methyltransferase